MRLRKKREPTKYTREATSKPKGLHRVDFVVAVDNQEKAPYTFEGLLADRKHGDKLLEIRRQWTHLKTGDYSIIGLQDLVTVERKSLDDLVKTLGQGRDRFRREHERMRGFEFAAVVVEASWEGIVAEVEPQKVKTLFRTMLSWSMRYGVHWYTFGSRRLAEVATFRLLERFWKEVKREDEEARRRALLGSGEGDR